MQCACAQSMYSLDVDYILKVKVNLLQGLESESKKYSRLVDLYIEEKHNNFYQTMAVLEHFLSFASRRYVCNKF